MVRGLMDGRGFLLIATRPKVHSSWGPTRMFVEKGTVGEIDKSGQGLGVGDHVQGEPIRPSVGQGVLAVFQLGTGDAGDVCGFTISVGLERSRRFAGKITQNARIFEHRSEARANQFSRAMLVELSNLGT
ncbi:hypothetical protein DLE01_09190 [Streptomyces sp. FT05W]|nr:hypothetical protein DLE01_09190 [Streptomyces sp. FT05W]